MSRAEFIEPADYKRSRRHSVRAAGLIALAAAFAGHSQPPRSMNYAVERIGTECLAMEGYPVPVAADECTVVDSGRLVVVDGLVFYYARYQITAEVPFWPSLRDVPPYPNSLTIFVGQENGGYATIYSTYNEDLSKFQRLSFPAPVVLDTPRGKVLNIRRRDTGDGMFQWFNDEYWIWQWNDWQRLDVTSWYEEAGSLIPSAYSVGGVSSEFFDLISLTNVSPVRRADDPDCCPSAGIVRVSFEWVDRALRIREATYDPDTDFRSLWP